MRSLSAILAHCKLDGDCLIWTGAVSASGRYQDGYPNAKIDGRAQRVHKVVWEIVNGMPVPDGYEVCHTCDRGLCVWPEHLWIGTHAQNMLDCRLKRRSVGHSPSGEIHHAAKLTEADVRAILRDTRYQRVIAADYGIGQAQVSAIKRGAKWKGIGSI